MASPVFAVKLWFVLEQARRGWVPVAVHAITTGFGERLQPVTRAVSWGNWFSQLTTVGNNRNGTESIVEMAFYAESGGGPAIW